MLPDGFSNQIAQFFDLHRFFINMCNANTFSMFGKNRCCILRAKSENRRFDFNLLIAVEILNFLNDLKPIFHRHLEICNDKVDRLVDTFTMRNQSFVKKLLHQVDCFLSITGESNFI